MASNHTCRACSRALLRSSPFASPINYTSRQSLRIAPAYRSLATAAPSPSTATKNKSTGASPPPPSSSSSDAATTKSPQNQRFRGLAAALRKRAPLLTETYVAYGASQDLFKECARHGDYTIPQALEKGGEIPTGEGGVHLGVGKGWWYDTLGLQPTFINWAQITFLHMYLLQVRIRMFPASHSSIWIQHLTNHAFYAAEDRLVVWHHLTSNSLRQRYLKDIFAQWRAVLLSYDEGLVKGDAVLAAALWRNLLGGREDVDAVRLAEVVAYVRRELAWLDRASDDEVASGGWVFGEDPGSEEKVVEQQSRGLLEGAKKA